MPLSHWHVTVGAGDSESGSLSKMWSRSGELIHFYHLNAHSDPLLSWGMRWESRIEARILRKIRTMDGEQFSLKDAVWNLTHKQTNERVAQVFLCVSDGSSKLMLEVHWLSYSITILSFTLVHLTTYAPPCWYDIWGEPVDSELI